MVRAHRRPWVHEPPTAREFLARYGPAIAGVTGIAASVITADVVAIHSGKPTISASVADALRGPWTGALTFGVGAVLAWHLFVHPVLERIDGD